MINSIGHALKKHVENSGMDEISDELDDVANQYKKLEHSRWARAYDKGWDAATHNKEAHFVGRRFETFEHSEEAHALGKELHELDQALKENVKVSDAPEDWKAEKNEQLLARGGNRQSRMKAESFTREEDTLVNVGNSAGYARFP